MKIACVMMQKNENALLRPWVEYHAALCGIENLYVLDNGSTESATRDLLAAYAKAGLNVNYEHVGRNAYARRESIVTEFFRELGRSNRHDFIFPLDCDEFLATQLADGTVSAEPTDILSGLEPFRNDTRVLQISSAYDNIPFDPSLFLHSPSQRKCFFTRGQCKKLGLGYHHGEAVSTSDTLKTNIVYIHLHNRPYRHYIYAAYEKLAARVPDFSPETLRLHSEERREGFHLISSLLMTEEQFNKRFPLRRAVPLPAFGLRLKALGIEVDFEHARVPDFQRAASLVRGHTEEAMIRDASVLIRGWALIADQHFPSAFKVLIGRHEMDAVPARRVKRLDIARAFEQAPQDTGFEIELPLSSLPSTARSGTVSVHVLEPESGLFIPLLCSARV